MSGLAFVVIILTLVLLAMLAVQMFVTRAQNTCPSCGSRNSGSFDDTNSFRIFHNRKCRDCGHTWSTWI